MNRKSLTETIEDARQSLEYRSYLEVRDQVLRMLDAGRSREDTPSRYWEEEIAGFDYMLDASPLVIRKLREHCHHITGLRAYEYRSHHLHQRAALENKLGALSQRDAHGLLVPESPALGGFGFQIDGQLINLDTLKFYESLLVMDEAGLLAPFREDPGTRRLVVEIGPGWGGFARQFKTLFPNVTYVLVDLPQTFLFSGVYLKSLLPRASTLFLAGEPRRWTIDESADCDFIFAPHTEFFGAQIQRVDLAINIASFQEMTTQQVEAYVRRLRELGCPNVYSHNRDHSPNNPELTSVSAIMGGHFEIREHNPLEGSYLWLPPGDETRDSKGVLARWRRDRRRRRRQRRTQSHERAAHDYRHLVGTAPG